MFDDDAGDFLDVCLFGCFETAASVEDFVDVFFDGVYEERLLDAFAADAFDENSVSIGVLDEAGVVNAFPQTTHVEKNDFTQHLLTFFGR